METKSTRKKSKKARALGAQKAIWTCSQSRPSMMMTMMRRSGPREEILIRATKYISKVPRRGPRDDDKTDDSTLSDLQAKRRQPVESRRVELR